MADDPTRLDEWGLIAKVSHDLRTPMNGILGLAELLQDSGLTAEQRRSVELIQISAESLLTITNDLLDFSRLRGERIELEHIPFDLVGLIDSTTRLLGVRAFERGIDISYQVAEDVPRTVRGDPSRMRQILTNLIGNAVKFTHEGGVFVLVTLDKIKGGKAALRFIVRDTGIGIPADKLDAIFDEYAQVDASTSRKYGGTGLGLSISRRLARMMGGDVEVTSEVDKGSEFTFTAMLEPTKEPPGEAPTDVTLSGARALVVDDNPNIRGLVQETLQSAGVQVDGAAGVEEGIQALQTAADEGTPYRLLIMDAWISRKDGYEIAKTVRDDPVFADTHIMMLTSAGRRGDGQRCRDVGIQAYLTKPVSGDELLSAVAVMLGEVTTRSLTLVTRHSLEEARRRLYILLAEDNVVNQQVATAVLRKRGHTVDIVDNGAAAVEAVTQAEYDVVLMDIEMPEMDGLAATDAIRSTPEGETLPIIALTAHAMGGERARYRAAGMDDCLTKPFRPQQLIQMVERLGAATLAATAVEDPPPPPPPVNLTEFRRSMREAGMEETVETILGVFLEDATERLTALEAAVQAADGDAVRMAAHAFRSAAATVRAGNLAELLHQVEVAGEGSDIEHAAELMPQVREEKAAVVDFLNQTAVL
ncbi:MAG: response regulator [Gemmatimonadota bacterium]|nr:response regulator [Gemmatimonadota bacterium]